MLFRKQSLSFIRLQFRPGFLTRNIRNTLGEIKAEIQKRKCDDVRYNRRTVFVGSENQKRRPYPSAISDS